MVKMIPGSSKCRRIIGSRAKYNSWGCVGEVDRGRRDWITQGEIRH